MSDFLQQLKEEAAEYILWCAPHVLVHPVPPQTSSGFRADQWEGCIWTGKLQICTSNDRCFIKLLDKNNGSLFAKCEVPEKYDTVIERCVDSSRYFVLRIDDGQGRTANIGLGFESRNDAFDFNCTINDYARRRIVELEESQKPPIEEQPQKDYSLKEGQKIKVQLKGLNKNRNRPSSNEAASNFHESMNASFS